MGPLLGARDCAHAGTAALTVIGKGVPLYVAGAHALFRTALAVAYSREVTEGPGAGGSHGLPAPAVMVQQSGAGDFIRLASLPSLGEVEIVV